MLFEIRQKNYVYLIFINDKSSEKKPERACKQLFSAASRRRPLDADGRVTGGGRGAIIQANSI